MFYYSRDRAGEHPRAHLANYTGILQADGYGGYKRFDYILALDVIEHLVAPEDFLDQLRALAARSGAQVIKTDDVRQNARPQ